MDLAVIVSTFERPRHLERCLATLAVQRGVRGRFEVVVTDDGSTDDTLGLVVREARRVPFPLSFTTHEHRGFQLARCRNEGAAASSAPYLLFTDGDCLLPPDHLAVHLAARRSGRIVGSDCIRLDEAATARLEAAAIAAGWWRPRIRLRERLRIWSKAGRAKGYEGLGLRLRPRLSGNNIAVWRDDFERVNGFDERFVGWGYEDVDFQDRCERAGLRVRSVLWRTAPVHQWHPTDATFARNGEGTANRRLFERGERPVVCVDGLMKHSSASVAVSLRRESRPELRGVRRAA
jgi:GT2 family glycosyltransferase